MSPPRATCRICRKVDRKNDFRNIFEISFAAATNDEVLLYDAMQQLASIEIIESTPLMNTICRNCSDRIQYAFRLRSEICESNERVLAEDGVRLAKLESTNDATEVYKIIDLEEKSSNAMKKEKHAMDSEFYDMTEHRIDIEFLDADGVGIGDDSAEAIMYTTEDDNDDSEEDAGGETSDSQAKPDRKRQQIASIDMDDEQDAVSFLLGNSHILDKMDEDDKGRTHLKSKSKRPHACKVCSKSFLRKSNLVDHLRLHANLRLYQCEFCDKSFVQAGNYKSHLRIHTKERPFKCTMCPKTYNQSSALKVHVRSHTNERNYVCDECQKAFTNSSDLSKHKRVHDPDQKTKCVHCLKTFAQKVNWRTHMRKHHPNESMEEASK